MLDINNYDKRCIILAGLERALENQKKTSILTTVKKSTEQSKMKLYAGIMIPSTVRAQLYQRYINPSALYKLHSSFDTSMSLNDLRRVTSIFLKIGSLKFADVSELHDAQAAARIVQSMMQKYEGILRQFNVDDKGAVLFACFGLPPLSHENDSVYGVKAALEIAREFSESFNQFSIGVTTGVISISGIGYKTRTEYALVGCGTQVGII